MAILETLSFIPLMFYLSVIFLPLSLWGYFTFPKSKKKIAAKSANPADVLKARQINAKRELISGFFLGATIAFAFSLLISLSWLISDYKNNRNLFAETLPPASYPPALSENFPPGPSTK